MPFGPICPRRRYPTWQSSLLRPAIQAYRDTSYEEIARYTLERVTEASIVVFQERLKIKLNEMRAVIGAMRRILDWSPHYSYRYRDEAALGAFEEWRAGMEQFVPREGLGGIEHSSDCRDHQCKKLQCKFHEENAERSLKVYPFDFDVVRDPRTGKIVEVAIFVERRY